MTAEERKKRLQAEKKRVMKEDVGIEEADPTDYIPGIGMLKGLAKGGVMAIVKSATKGKRKEKIIKYLKDMIKKNPKNETLKDVQKKIQNKKAIKEAFESEKKGVLDALQRDRKDIVVSRSRDRKVPNISDYKTLKSEVRERKAENLEASLMGRAEAKYKARQLQGKGMPDKFTTVDQIETVGRQLDSRLMDGNKAAVDYIKRLTKVRPTNAETRFKMIKVLKEAKGVVDRRVSKMKKPRITPESNRSDIRERDNYSMIKQMLQNKIDKIKGGGSGGK